MGMFLKHEDYKAFRGMKISYRETLKNLQNIFISVFDVLWILYGY